MTSSFPTARFSGLRRRGRPGARGTGTARQRPSGPGGGGFGGGPNPPNLEELLRRSQDRFRQFMPGGSVSGRGILLLILVAIAIWFGTGFYRVDTDEQRVVLRCGDRKCVSSGKRFS